MNEMLEVVEMLNCLKSLNSFNCSSFSIVERSISTFSSNSSKSRNSTLKQYVELSREVPQHEIKPKKGVYQPNPALSAKPLGAFSAEEVDV